MIEQLWQQRHAALARASQNPAHVDRAMRLLFLRDLVQAHARTLPAPQCCAPDARKVCTRCLVRRFMERHGPIRNTPANRARRHAEQRKDQTMTFPFTNPETGGICCTDIRHPCPECRKKLNARGARLRPPSLAERVHAASGTRRLSAEDFTPPDPYAAGLKKLREQESQRTPPATRSTRTAPAREDFTPPNPYDIALKRGAK